MRRAPDVTAGIVQAIEALRSTHDFEGDDISAVMIGTTHFINALVEAKRLAPTAALRLGLPATKALPPLVDWPEQLKEAIGARSYLAHGGYEFDGRPISPLDHAEFEGPAADMAEHGIRSVAISSVFSPVNHDVEAQAAAIVADELGDDVAISLSHEIGRIGLLERENATIINAALRELASEIVDGLTAAVRAQGIGAPIFLSQNDGTLMDEEYVRLYPVATFASGPTNSMRGAAAHQRPGDVRRRRHRRHHRRHRTADQRLPARDGQRGEGRRGAHQLPDARRAVDRHRRRHPS